jgi:hypothetical protein
MKSAASMLPLEISISTSVSMRKSGMLIARLVAKLPNVGETALYVLAVSPKAKELRGTNRRPLLLS